MKPVLFVTNHVPPDRVGAFAALAERVPLRLALFGGASRHATPGVDPPVEHVRVAQRDVRGLAASGDFSFVVAGTVGRVALPAAFAGARRSGTPFVLWSALWHQPRSAAHLAFAAGLRTIHRRAHAVVTYGPHVSAFARRLGARRVHEAPQAVDRHFWEAPVPGTRHAPFQALFIGREAPEKGAGVAVEAWRASGLVSAAALVLVGLRSGPPLTGSGHAVAAVGPRSPEQVRDFLGGSDVLVMPSLRTATFREPWGLAANEAMHQSVPVIASTEVGAAAGGLVRHERNGLIVPAGDAAALGAALARLHADGALRRRLGDAARRDVAAYTHDAWAEGFRAALR